MSTKCSSIKCSSYLTAFALLSFLLSGCQPAATSSKDSDGLTTAAVKLSLKETLEKVTGMATKIGEGFADGVSDEAHDALHEIGHLLEGAEKLVADSTLADEAKTALATAVKDLMDGFDEVDARLHDKNEGLEYSEVKEKIESALKVVTDTVSSLK